MSSERERSGREFCKWSGALRGNIADRSPLPHRSHDLALNVAH